MSEAWKVLMQLEHWIPIVGIDPSGDTIVNYFPSTIIESLRMLAHFRAIDWCDE